jgi:hypothetical protein
VFNILKNEPRPLREVQGEIAKDANAGKVKLAEPWESLRVLIMPKSSEEERLMRGRGAELYSKYREDENYKRALFYAALRLEEAFGVYRTALREYAKGLKEVVQRVVVGEEPFERVMYVADLGRLTQLAEEEEKAFENALRVLRERLNEYAVRHGLRDLLNVEGGWRGGWRRRRRWSSPEFSGVNFGVKALAALSPIGSMRWAEGSSVRRLGIGLRWAGLPGSSTMRRVRRTKRPRRLGWRGP